jgi:hypothetical protein
MKGNSGKAVQNQVLHGFYPVFTEGYKYQVFTSISK